MNAINLSPVDAALLPSLTMVNEIGGEVAMGRKDFWDCCKISLGREQYEILEKRKRDAK